MQQKDIALCPAGDGPGEIQVSPRHRALRTGNRPVGHLHPGALDATRGFREPFQIPGAHRRISLLRIFPLILRQARHLPHQGEKQVLHTVEDLRMPPLPVGGAREAEGGVEFVDGAQCGEAR